MRSLVPKSLESHFRCSSPAPSWALITCHAFNCSGRLWIKLSQIYVWCYKSSFARVRCVTANSRIFSYSTVTGDDDMIAKKKLKTISFHPVPWKHQRSRPFSGLRTLEWAWLYWKIHDARFCSIDQPPVDLVSRACRDVTSIRSVHRLVCQTVEYGFVLAVYFDPFRAGLPLSTTWNK